MSEQDDSRKSAILAAVSRVRPGVTWNAIASVVTKGMAKRRKTHRKQRAAKRVHQSVGAASDSGEQISSDSASVAAAVVSVGVVAAPAAATPRSQPAAATLGNRLDALVASGRIPDESFALLYLNEMVSFFAADDVRQFQCVCFYLSMNK